jgi:hypothetical protein
MIHCFSTTSNSCAVKELLTDNLDMNWIAIHCKHLRKSSMGQTPSESNTGSATDWDTADGGPNYPLRDGMKLP